MKRKGRYEPIISNEQLQKSRQVLAETFLAYVLRLQEQQEVLLKALDGMGPEDFSSLLAMVLDMERDKLLKYLEQKGPQGLVWLVIRLLEIRSEKVRDYADNRHVDPELRDDLEDLRQKGWPTDHLRGARVGRFPEAPRLWIELPLDADLKEYLLPMRALQEHFQSLEKPDSLVRYLADEHGRGRTYRKLADELEEATIAWANGETTSLDLMGLDSFLRAKGNTPEKFKTYNEDQVRYWVRYYRTRK